MCLLVAGAHADDAAQITGLESSKSVFLPTTPNDFSGMIYSLLQEQSSRIANKDGAQVRSNPSHDVALHAWHTPCLRQLAFVSIVMWHASARSFSRHNRAGVMNGVFVLCICVLGSII